MPELVVVRLADSDDDLSDMMELEAFEMPDSEDDFEAQPDPEDDPEAAEADGIARTAPPASPPREAPACLCGTERRFREALGNYRCARCHPAAAAAAAAGGEALWPCQQGHMGDHPQQ